MLFLELVIVGRSLIEHSLELLHSTLGIFRLLSSVLSLLMGKLGLLPQLVVAAEQVVE
jgi:hypothetical protein